MSSSVKLLRSLCRVACTSRVFAMRGTTPHTTKTILPPLQQAVRWASPSAQFDPDDPRTFSNKHWEERLTPEQYLVCREKHTEPPFTGAYTNKFEKGMYDCICCRAELFSSETKYDSGTGWPSFTAAHSKIPGDESSSNILRRSDNSDSMVRTEIICKKCDSHLGHVFPDGPKNTERFCINSRALWFRET
ncbi:methionine-R-sulfoxide reductase B2, mitochondrial-like [Mizuhopecten yessoensis]|uniref:methionine-R-sulfoxide reductase B2, mitochondrial-like n=1 Tax=Mizuhopecten yessoensis TaxID=6573 RepID=UPI000B4574D1|nr:methionine-R-sulfoxide reductase B2, mitochondrial-like [Mizuhopecten yessoensis]